MTIRTRSNARITTAEDVYIANETIADGNLLVYDYVNTRFYNESLYNILKNFITPQEWNQLLDLDGINIGGDNSSGGDSDSSGSTETGNWVTIDTEQTITGQKYFTKSVLSELNVVAFYTGQYDFEEPLATNSSVGLASFDSTYFNIDGGHVTLNLTNIGDKFGNIYYAGVGLYASTGQIENDTFNVAYGNELNTALRGDITYWGQAVQLGESNKPFVDGTITIEDFITLELMPSEYFYRFRISFTDGERYNTLFDGSALATENVVAWYTGNYDLTNPIASTDALGLIRIGTGLSIDANGVVSVTGGGEGVISNITITGTGNALSDVSLNADRTVMNFTKSNFILGNATIVLTGDTTSTSTSFTNFLTASVATNTNMIRIIDSRSVNNTPYQSGYTQRASFHFKQNSIDGLSDGGTYHHILHTIPGDNTSYGSAFQIAFTQNGNLYRRFGTTSWSAWVAFAKVTDNVASATQLQTTRTLWGQNFNGTQNVSGNLTSANGLTPASNGLYDIGSTSLRYRIGWFSGNIWIGNANQTNTATYIESGLLQLSHNNPTISFLYGATGTVTAGLRGVANNAIYLYTRLYINSSTGNSLYNLYVNGAARATGAIVSENNVCAFVTGNYNLTSPIATYTSVGMCRFNSAHFTVSSDGLVSLR